MTLTLRSVRPADGIAPLDQIYSPYRERIEAYRRVFGRDQAKALLLLSEAQEIERAWRAGFEHARAGG